MQGGEMAKRVILLVDDSSINRDMLEVNFISDYIVRHAENGSQGLEFLREHPETSAVILDLDMPVMNGYQMLEAMKHEPKLSHIPVVVITATGDEDNQIKALDMGAMDVITKPFRPRIVRHRIDAIIVRRENEQLEEENRVYEKLLRQSELDERTGIYNKQAFCRRTAAMLAANPGERFVLFRWDIDRFKVLNDVFGVANGDLFLEDVGAAYKANTCATMTYGRWVADHFVTCMRREDFERFGVIDKICGLRSERYGSYDLTTRMGIYEVEDPTLDVSLMCDRALLALQSVKNSYTNRVAWYNSSMRDALIEEQELTAEMVTALDNGQFEVFFQPQYDYDNKVLHGAEALVRWRHPQKGLLPPSGFIPYFERNGFISKLDEYVWETVCQNLRRWKEMGLRIVPVSVNISRIDLYNPRLCEILLGMVERNGLEPSMLRLEITESAYMSDPDQLVRTVENLRSAGFMVEMDDFGSGYSSLNTLKDVPVDMLKLDMRFIESGKDSARSGSILTSVVRMAQWIKLPMIAEGVETNEQADYLKSIGCMYLQGFYFSKPMQREEFEQLLASQKDVPIKTTKRPVDIEGAENFLNASTQATLLFNSFVGGAQIIEYDGDGCVESLRANDRYFEVIGCEREIFYKRDRDMLTMFCPDSAAELLRILELAAETGQEQQCELHYLPLGDGGKEVWTLARVRYLARTDKRCIYYMASENITERKELDALRMRLSDIISNVPAGIAIYRWGKHLHAEYISQRACDMLGYTKEEYQYLLENHVPITLADHFSARENEIRSTLLSGQTVDTVVPVVRKDGSWFWLRLVCSMVTREGQSPLIYATLFDATEQRNNEEKLGALLSTAPCGIFKYQADEEGRITYISESMLRMLGYTREQFAEKFDDRFPLMIWKDDRSRVLESIYNHSLSGTRSNDICEYRIETADGSLKWVYDVGKRVMSIDGKEWVYVVIVDIDHQHQLENIVCQTSRKAEALVANAPGGVVSFVIVEGQIDCTYVSDAVCRRFNATREQVMSLFAGDVTGVLHPDDRRKVLVAAQRAAKELSTFEASFRVRITEGEYIWINAVGNPVVGDEGTVYYCSCTDITRYVRTEEKLRAEKRKLQLALANVSAVVWDYSIQTGTAKRLSADPAGVTPKSMGNVPQAAIEGGYVHPDYTQPFLELYEAVNRGEECASAVILLKVAEDCYRMHEITMYTLFEDGNPTGAVCASVLSEDEEGGRRPAAD